MSTLIRITNTNDKPVGAVEGPAAGGLHPLVDLRQVERWHLQRRVQQVKAVEEEERAVLMSIIMLMMMIIIITILSTIIICNMIIIYIMVVLVCLARVVPLDDAQHLLLEEVLLVAHSTIL